MDHVVYLDTKAKEYEKLASGEKSMIIRGAAGRKLPHGRVFENDTLYFMNNNAEGTVRGRAKVKFVINSEKMTSQESEALIASHENQLQLSDKQKARWAGKRYLVLIEVKDFEEIAPFPINRSEYGNMDDWLPVDKIERVKL